MANEVKLKPVTEISKRRFAMKPPTKAPRTPNIIVPTIPPCAGLGSIKCAMTPAKSPNIIQLNMFISFIIFFTNKRKKRKM